MVHNQTNEQEITKPMRPNDMCTAAFYNDVKKLQKLLAVDEVEPGPGLPEDFSVEEAAAELDAAGVELGQEGEEDPEVLEEITERAERKRANELRVRGLLTKMDRIVTRLSPVHVKYFGLFVHLDEFMGEEEECDTHNENKNNNNNKDITHSLQNSSVRTGVVSRRVKAHYKPSPRSDIPATPLMWAVLGRSHDAIEYLISMGADNYYNPDDNNNNDNNNELLSSATVEGNEEANYSPEQQERLNKIYKDIFTRTEATPGAPVCRSPVFNLTAEEIAIANRSLQSLNVLRKAREDFKNKETMRKEQEYIMMKTKMERNTAVAAFRAAQRAEEEENAKEEAGLIYDDNNNSNDDQDNDGEGADDEQ
eukprot:Tbor_TRINITY_DN5325_c3_g10::TRINITY_DN5325_c3_g10_i1::g.5036::m.5036